MTDADYATMKKTILALWDQVKSLEIPFRDLLGLLDAATKYHELSDFDTRQQEAIGNAFRDLSRGSLDFAIVDRHIERFADLGIDIIGPLRPWAIGLAAEPRERT
jgi:hypothetical protein